MSDIWKKYTTDWDYHTEQVMRFNALCGNSGKKLDTLKELYSNLCVEEAEEALAAYNSEDIHGNSISEEQALNDLVDAACDLFYVGKYYQHVTDAYCSSVNGSQNSLGNLMFRLACWVTEQKEHQGSTSALPVDTSVHLLSILKVDPDEALNKVHESNFSKFMDVTGIPLEDIAEIAEAEEEEIKQTYTAKGKPLKTITYKVTLYKDESWLTFYNENGKVLKPSGFFEPDFTDVIKHLI
jgi:hypothetical protein